jgi:hypothetical protein
MSLLKKISSNFVNSTSASGSSEKIKNELPEKLSNEKINQLTESPEPPESNTAASGELGYNEKKSEQPAGDGGPTLPAPIPCLFCSCPAIWLDFNNNVHCYQCEPPPSQSMIRGRWTLSEDNGDPATWIDRGAPGKPERTDRPARQKPGERQVAKATTTGGRGGKGDPPPAAAAMIERIDHGQDYGPWIETIETDSQGIPRTIYRPAHLAARGPLFGYGFSTFDRDPDDPEGKRIVFGGLQWFDW